MATLPIDFRWSRDVAGYDVRGSRIVRRSSSAEEVRPLDFHETLYGQFARLDDRPESFAEFMAMFGPLTHEGHYLGEDVRTLMTLRRRMHDWIEMSARAPRDLLKLDALSPARQAAIAASWDKAIEGASGQKPLKSQPRINAAAVVRAIFKPGAPDGRPTLCLAPDTLWDAMLLQFYQAIGAGSRVKACAYCGNWFEVGPTGKRADARFCSNDCRIHSHLKAKGTKP
jgi:hypothetical protein